MNILALMAHENDAAFFCFGALSKYLAQGHSIYMAVAAGDKDPLGACALAAKVRLWGLSEGQIYDSADCRAAATDTLLWADPDIIITHAPWDGEGDHALLSKIATSVLPENKKIHLFFTDTLAENMAQNGYGQRYVRTTDQTFYLTPGVYSNAWAEPVAYVDVTKQMDQKLSLLADDEAVAALCKTRCRICGYKMGATFAEAFSGYRMPKNFADIRLLP